MHTFQPSACSMLAHWLRPALTALAVACGATSAVAGPFDDIRRQIEKGVKEQVDKALPVPRPDQGATGASQTPSPKGAQRKSGAPHVQPLQVTTTSSAIVPVEIPVVDGRPVIGYIQLLTRDAFQQEQHLLGDANLLRWMVLMNIAHRPAVLEKPRFALHVAAMFLPPEHWNDHLGCHMADRDCAYELGIRMGASNRMPGHGQSYMHPGAVRDWKGRNEFERPRSHRAFVEQYRSLLISQASKLPQEILLFQPFNLGQKYDPARQLLPVPAFYATPERLLTMIPLVTGYCVSTSLQWPAGIAASPEQAEALINRLGPQRSAYAALRLRLKRVDGEAIPTITQPFTSGAGNCQVDADVLDLTIYADPALTTKLHTFALRSGSKAPSN